MQNKAATGTNAQETVAELFQLQIEPNDAKLLVDNSDLVHKFFSAFEGYHGLDMIFLSEAKVIILLRWTDFNRFDKNLPTILNGCPIKEWFKNAVHLSHQPVILKSIFKK